MKTLPILVLLILGGCTASRPPLASTPVAVAAPVPPAPTSEAPKRPPFVWLEAPPATPARVLAIFEYISPGTKERDAGLEQSAIAVGANALLRLPDLAVIRGDLGTALIAPTLTIPPAPWNVARVRYAALKFLPANPFVVGYYDDISRQFVSGEEGSLYRFEPGRRYSNFGRYVRSPFAPERPPVNIVGLPDGATVVCPYTNRTFQLW